MHLLPVCFMQSTCTYYIAQVMLEGVLTRIDVHRVCVVGSYLYLQSLICLAGAEAAMPSSSKLAYFT